MTRHSYMNAKKEIKWNAKIKPDQGILQGHNRMK